MGKRMDTAAYRKVRLVFDEVFELEGASLQARLDELCGDDLVLRAEVLELLESAPEVDGLGFAVQMEGGLAQAELFRNGRIIDRRYVITGYLGRGGAAEVYSAWDRELQRELAIKAPTVGQKNDPEHQARFRREVRLAQEVTHRNVCRVYGLHFWDDNGDCRSFMTMELIAGRTLARVIADKERQNADRGRDLIGQIAEGLNALHERGIVHRDLKPSNIMIENDSGRVVIMDFGIAKRDPQSTLATTGLTEEGKIVGTLAYMAPEQILPGRKVGITADIYALGAIMHELITGLTPSQKRVDLGGYLTLATAHWADVVERCLADNPDARPATARELIAILDAAASVARDDAPLPAEDPAGESDTKDGRESKRRLTVSLIATGLVALASTLVIAGLFEREVPRSSEPMPGSAPGSLAELVGMEPRPLTSDPTEIRSLFEKGKAYLIRHDRSKDVDMAVAHFRRMVELHPDAALGHAGLAEAYCRTYKWTRDRQWRDLADRSAQAALKLGNDIPEVHIALGLFHETSDRYREALGDYHRAIELDPGSSEAHLGLGMAYRGLGHPVQAEEAFQRSIELDRNWWEAWRRLAGQYYVNGDYVRARENYEKAVALTPDNSQLQNALGYMHYLGGRVDDAVVHYEQAVAIAESRRPCLAQDGVDGEAPRTLVQYLPLSNLGELELERRDYERAERFLRASIRCNENWHTPWGLLGEVYLARDGAAAASPYFERAKTAAAAYLETRPRYSPTMAYLAGFLARLGERDESERQLGLVLSAQIDDPRTLARCGEVLMMLDEREKAIALLSRASQLGFPMAAMRGKPGLRKLSSGEWDAVARAARQGAGG